MSAFSIEWHKVCLRNQRESLQRDEEELSRLTIKVAARRADVAFYRHQIDEAYREGKTEFDRERYRVKRGPNKRAE